MSALARLAARAPVPVHACIGPGMLGRVETLMRSRRLRRVASPRETGLLLAAGEVPGRAAIGYDRVHDQLAHPRAVVRWDGSDDPTALILATWAEALAGGADAGDRLPDTPPAPWQGRGEHGQGGEGMMGGVPYGRPMAMTGADIRDGLELDAYAARIGPFAAMLPPGMELDLTLQGDVIMAAEVAAPPFAQDDEANGPHACAARLLRLMGLVHAADRVAFGERPRILWGCAALPRELGRAPDGSDARSRLAAWLDGRTGPGRAPDPAEALPGLEWHEATLVLNSFSPESLRRACRPEAQ